MSTKDKDEFDELVNEFGADLDYSTLKIMLESKINTYTQFWVFLIGFVFTLVSIYQKIEIKTTSIQMTLVYVILSLVFAIFVALVLTRLFAKDPLKNNTELIKQYEKSRIKLDKLKQSKNSN